MFAYCGNNPVNRSDFTGAAWEHWALAAGIVAIAAAAVVIASGGVAAAAFAVASVANGVAVSSTVATVAAGAFVGSAYGLAASAYGALIESDSAAEFADYGESGLLSTAVGGAFGGVSAYSLDGHTCFVEGTEVKTENGDVPIEQITVGMLVWSWDENTGDVGLKGVVETYENETYQLVHLFVDGEEIVSTPSHPFYSPVNGWTQAVHLRAGDILVLVNGEYVVIERVQHEILESPVKVYNFQVEDYHTYFISNNGLLVHNRCERGVGGKGWRGDQAWRQNVRTVDAGGDILELNGGIPTGSEARALISEANGLIGAYHNAHPVGGISTHTYNHIHYTTAAGIRSAIKVLAEF